MQHSKGNGRGEGLYMWNGKPVHYCIGSSDTAIIYSILLKRGRKSEYWLPEHIDPKVILDIGGNVGITSIYLANRFPNAQIFTFEPIKENFQVLSKNVASFPNITGLNIALSDEDGQKQLIHSPEPHNFGGFSFFQREAAGDATKITVATRRPESILKELGVAHVDLIKIDTEGAEYDILTHFDPEILKSVRWISGELHGEKDFELLAYLSQWFDIGLKKSLVRKLFMFNACNKAWQT